MPPVRTIRNILMELRKVCQHPYLSAPELENEDASKAEQHKALTEASGKLSFLKLLLPKLKERGHRVLLFSQFKIALNIIEDFLAGEGYKFFRLDGDIQQAQRQKSMDAFNAPDSEYFIFLLTTRAGGVGINLATADTVIVYDPDFNPHMDLQAIARSHRYGQKKSTLVFKLMTRDSVEEQIVLNGKKKMVLDHLVVQQMGKENEEGDIDNMLLHGAAALYDTNAEGYSASDIRYTSKMVDELIDKVEADALAETKAMEEREKLKEVDGNVIVDGGAPPKPKDSMSFAFAKIWEADQNRVREMSDDEDEEDKVDEDATAWQQLWENMERERQAKLLADGGQRLRQRQAAAATKKYALIPDGAISDHSDTNSAKLANSKGKSKGHSDFSDGDWYSNPAEDSESDEDLSTLVADGMDISDIVNGKAVPKPRQPLANMEEAAARAKAGEALEKAIKGGTAPEFAAAAAAQREAKKAEGRMRKEAARVDVAHGAGLSAAARSVARLKDQSTGQNIFNGLNGSGSQVPAPRPDRTTTRNAQHVIQWLYHVLSNLGMKAELDIWARMALPEVPGDQRTDLYDHLAERADTAMWCRGQKPYFGLTDIKQRVVQLLVSGGSVMPDETDLASTTLPRVPNRLGNMRPEYTNLHSAAPEVNQPPKKDHARINASQPVSSGPPKVPTIARPASQNPLRTNNVPPAPKAVSSTAAAAQTVTTPGAPAKPQAGPSRQTTSDLAQSDLLDRLTATRPQECLLCHGQHALSGCNLKVDVATLERLRAYTYRRDLEEQQKLLAIAEIDAAIQQIMMNPPPPREPGTPRMPATTDGRTISTPSASGSRPNGSVSMSAAKEVIVIDDDETDDERPTKRARTSHQNGEASEGSPAVRCVICGSTLSHAPQQCPIVKAGPESIKSALRRFQPNESTWKILKEVYDRLAPAPVNVSTPQHVCAFCDTVCGKTTRQCATDVHGSSAAGRKALKARIRQVEALNETNGGLFKGVADELFDVYLKWEK